MTDWALVNARKMSKAVYLLLERYHRSHGLGIVGCFRPVGAQRFYFYCHAVRDSRGRAKYMAEEAYARGCALMISQRECRLVGQQRYLLAWNVLGLVSASRTDPGAGGIATSGRLDMFDYELDGAAVQAFGLRHPDEDVHYCRGIAISSDARAYVPAHGVRDLWQEHLDGTPVRDIATSLLATAGE